MIFAHGISSRGDLPLPLWMFTWAAAIALVVSFVALGLLWPSPRLARASAGRPVLGGGAAGTAEGSGASAGVLRTLELLGRVAALALFVICLGAGLFGSNEVSSNILPVTLYVMVWVGGQLVSGLIGDVWGRISPITTLARGLEALGARIGHRPGHPPARLGQWPAAAGLFVFLFYELARPSAQQPRVLGQLLAVHLVICLVAAWLWGADWIATHEPMAALFGWLGGMAPLFGTGDGRLAVRPPMSGLTRIPGTEPATGERGWGTLAALLIVLGGTTFDGFSASTQGQSWFPRATTWGEAAWTTVGVVGSIALIAAIYALGIAWTRRVTGMAMGDAALAFAPSLVPIVFGYAIAHYALLLIDESQTFWFRLSDPFGQGWNLFGGQGGTINFTLIGVSAMAWIQMLAILFGHIGAIVVAHDRSIELFDAGQSVRSQFAMLLVMVAYSTLGLWLLLKA